jgi:hypothetical protein
MTVIDFAGRRVQAEERRKREADWRFAYLASQLPPDELMAIFRAVTTGSEEPLMTLPIADRQLAIDRFRTLMNRAPAKVVTLPER